jgi:uroporphyrinogen III methyltransferase / synthase
MSTICPTAVQSLAGKRIIITRARPQAATLAQSIEDCGGIVIEFPTIEIRPATDTRPLDEAIGRLERYDWLMFTSVNGVESFFSRLGQRGKSAQDLSHIQCVAIGPETAKRLESAGITNCLVPTAYQAEGILEVLPAAAMKGKHVLIPRAAKAREVLPETLRRWGAKVDVVEAYQTVVPQSDTSELRGMLRGSAADMITFTSSSTVRNFTRLFGGQSLNEILGATPIACIGPITKDTVEELGGTAAVIAHEFTIAGLVRAMVGYFCNPSLSS